MSLLVSFLIALGLSIDTFAVAISSGILKQKVTFKSAVKYSIIMSLFQALMLIIGWSLGRSISSMIESYDHWLAFGLLFIVGANMIVNAFKKEPEKKINPLKLSIIIVLAFATSIDSLAVGFGFAFSEINIYLTSAIIGLVTFFASMIGLLLGKKSAVFYGKKLEFIGGLIIIAIGVKILVEHLLNH